MIELQNVTKNYGLNFVLRGVDLQVSAGEFVTLVGPNGAGKTTLMRILATLLKPSAGVVKIGGWPLPSHAQRVRRHIGLVSHKSLLYGDLSAADNLRFFAQLYALNESEARIEEALETVGLRPRQHDYVRTFSRGMTQRLAIARATLHNPEVLLLDEPYSGLDPAAVRILDALLQEQSALGRTIFLITHDLAHGLNICDRLFILDRGQIARDIASETISQSEFLDLYAHITQQRGGRDA